MSTVFIVLATFFNIIILRWKFRQERYVDMTIDVSMLLILSWVFGGTMQGLAVATSVSAMFSLYLLASPPKVGNYA